MINNLLKKLNLSSVQYYLLIALAFSFPFGRRYTTWVMISWVAIWILNLVYTRNHSRRIFSDVLTKPVIFLAFPVALYFLTIFGLLYTSDRDQGFFELEKKISLLLFPLLFFLFKEHCTSIRIQGIFIGFLSGMLTCSLISIGLGFYYSIRLTNGHLVFRTAVNDAVFERGDSFLDQVTQGGNYFFGEYISPFMHTSYYGMYLSFGAMVLYYLAKDIKRKWLTVIFFATIIIVLLFTDSKGALVSFIVASFLVVFFAKPSKFKKIILSAIFSVIIILIFISPRTSLFLKDFNKTITNINYNSTESTALRVVMWRAGVEVVKDNWLFGVGTGDGDLEIQNRTERLNKLAFDQKLNAHNEYLQTFITLGLLGIIILGMLLWLPYLYSLKNGVGLFSSFLVIISFNMLFESIFETFQGVVFFSFFYCLQIMGLINKGNEDFNIS